MKLPRPNRRSIYEYEQPFDLFEEFERGHASSHPSQEKAALKSGKKFLFLALLFVSAIALTVLGIGLYSRPTPTKPFVLLELRAISEDGHPVAGAKVYIKHKEFGVTDSFGEWRRYLKLRPGVSFEVRLKKDIAGGPKSVAAKRIRIPETISPLGDTEVKVSLELKAMAEPKRISKRLRDQEIDPPRHESLSSRAGQNQPTSQRVPNRREGQNQKDSIHLDQIDIRYLPATHSYNTLMEAHQSRVLGNRIVPEMVALVSEDGLTMSRNASWKYDISYVPHYGNVGFIKGSVRWTTQSGETNRLSFLRNFAKTIEESADLMVKMVRDHVNRQYNLARRGNYWVLSSLSMPSFWLPKGEPIMLGEDQKLYSLKRTENGFVLPATKSPCQGHLTVCTVFSASLAERPPVKSWTSADLRVRSPLPHGSEIYVSGFRAFPNPGEPQMWRYWANPGQVQNLTILVDNKIYFRTRFRHYPGEPLTLTIPQTIAKR